VKKVVFLTVIVLIACNVAFSQFSISGEYRPRMIIDNGYKGPKETSDPAIVSISQRTRINFGYGSEKLETYLSVQDVRFWGDDDRYSSSGLLGNTASLSVHQAWFALKPTSEIIIKTGRQQFSYDDQRLLSRRGWNDYQVTYDAVLFKYDNGKSRLDVAGSWNTNGSKNTLYTAGKMKTIDFVRYEYNLDNLKLSAIAIMSGVTRADTISDLLLTGTTGIGAVYNKNGFDARFYGYYQTRLNQLNAPTDAWCLSLFAKQKIKEGKASLGAGFDLLSGNDETNTDAAYQKTNHLFNLLYGVRHGAYGYMDYYSSTPAQGLQDFMLKADYSVAKNANLQLAYHYFRLSANKLAANGTDALDKSLGSEVDLTLKWKIYDFVSLQAGYSFYLTTPTTLEVKNASGQTNKFPQFGYLLVSVTPGFL
jgi:hypothetical protein